MAFDHGDIAALALLDCWAVFDSVNHDILLRKLSESFGVDDATLQWLTSYLRARLQCVRYGGGQSEYKAVNYVWCPTGIGPRTTPFSTKLNSARWSLLIICMHTNTLTMYTHMNGDH